MTDYPPPQEETKTSKVVQTILQFKAEMLLMERDSMSEMAQRWIQVESNLTTVLNKLTEELNVQIKLGANLSVSKLMKMERYQELLRQVRVEITRYNQWAEGNIKYNKSRMAQLGLNHSHEVLQSMTRNSGVVISSFNLLSKNAVETMIAYTRSGTPLSDLLKESYPDTVGAITDKLTDATARGLNPRDLAKELARSMSVGLNRALLISRTEQLRTYREASRLNYEQTGLVPSYRRIATKDDRTCMACLIADGDRVEVGEFFEEHPQGRCTMVPDIQGLAPVTWLKGEDWFIKQEEATQQRMMGQQRFEAWKEGKFELSQLVSHKHDDTWGGSITTTALRDLID